jgi:hypothetical protein
MVRNVAENIHQARGCFEPLRAHSFQGLLTGV